MRLCYPTPTRLFGLLLLGGLLLVLLLSPKELSLSQEQFPSDLTGVNAAVYSGGTSSANFQSRTALTHMFEWMNATVDWVNASQIRNHVLDNYDILIIPALAPGTIYNDLNPTGRDIMETWVAEGGAYFCIVGGIFFEWEFLPFIDMELIYPVPEVGSGIQLTEIAVNRYSTGPYLFEESASLEVTVWTPGYFETENWTGINVIATYPESQLPAMVTFQVDEGRAFFSSPHPEFEELSDRDGSTAFDENTDPDTEWPLLLRISQWLLHMEQPSIPSPPLSPLILLAISVGSVVAVVAIVVIIRRKRR